MMWSRWRRKDTPDGVLRPLAWRWIVLYTVMALSVSGVVIWWLWPPALESPTEAIKARAEAVRTGLVAAGAAGAGFTLWLAVRRQHSTETMNAATQHDAEQRRMTELYTAAAEQLGHESAAVRLAGLYALQRLGQSHPEQRAAIVNVWCAYLRMPFDDPTIERRQTGPNSFTVVPEAERAALNQELQVRLTVQRLLREHVHSGPHKDEPVSPRYWGDELDVDLTGATLYKLDLADCYIHPRTNFTSATFFGDATFADATFAAAAWFENATFLGDATFTNVTFLGHARFLDATFTGDATFTDATFTNVTWYVNTTFTGNAWFENATFIDAAQFLNATFTGDAWFDGITFTDGARFTNATFAAHASFSTAIITKTIRFDRAVARSDEQHIWPAGWGWIPDMDVAVPEGGNPNIPWGRLVRVPKDSGAGPDAATADGAKATQP